MAEELPELLVRGRKEWREWLGQNLDQARGVWLVLAKKGATDPTTLSYDEALEEALCHGWIDGQIGRRSESTYRQRFTPRRPKSNWSARNVERVKRLIAEGRMHPRALAEAERARKSGSWDRAYPAQSEMEVPPDLADALEAAPAASAMFQTLTGQNRYAILYRLHTAKRAETRARKIEEYVAMLGRGETIYPQKESPRGPE